MPGPKSRGERAQGMLPHRAISPRSWPSAEVASLSRSRSDPHFATDPIIDSSPDLFEGIPDTLPLICLAGAPKSYAAFSSYAAWKLPAAAALARPAQEWSDLTSTTSEASRNLGRLTPVGTSYGGPVILIKRRRTVPPSAVGGHARRRRWSRKRAAIVDPKNSGGIP